MCPQHDLLYGDLTAADQIRFWARFKGVPKREVSRLVVERLNDVKLCTHLVLVWVLMQPR